MWILERKRHLSLCTALHFKVERKNLCLIFTLFQLCTFCPSLLLKFWNSSTCGKFVLTLQPSCLLSATTCCLGNSHRNWFVHEDGRCLSLEIIFKAGFYLYSPVSNPVVYTIPNYSLGVGGSSLYAGGWGCNSGELQQAGGIGWWNILKFSKAKCKVLHLGWNNLM